MEIKINTQSSIKIITNKIIYFDPYLIKDEMHDAKIIFITHSHYDHFDINSINNIRNDDTYIVIPDDKDILDVLDFSEDKILIVKPNNKYDLLGISFLTVPAYNINKSFHKREYEWVGYVLNYNNNIYYVMGDTDSIDEAREVKCDYLFIPIGGYYTMDYTEASILTNLIHPKKVFPIHYGSIVGDKSFGDDFSKLVADDIEVNILLK